MPITSVHGPYETVCRSGWVNVWVCLLDLIHRRSFLFCPFMGPLGLLGTIYCMSKVNTTSVLWLTLTENRTKTNNLTKQLDTYDDFLWALCKHTKCHIETLSGFDHRESHSHHEVIIPSGEVERFWKRWTTFSPSKHWKFKHLHYEPWNEAKANRSYITEKHAKLEWKKCPRSKSSCRKGRCTHFTPKDD